LNNAVVEHEGLFPRVLWHKDGLGRLHDDARCVGMGSMAVV
jgi:hypothetical protein